MRRAEIAERGLVVGEREKRLAGGAGPEFCASDIEGPGREAHRRILAHAMPVAVCVPVRNEEAEIDRLLDGIAAQSDCDFLDLILCVFLDGCTDRSAAILCARAPALPFPILTRAGDRHPIPNAGRARRAAMDIGRSALRGRDGVLLTTDADTVPASDWIARSREALRDADLVTGRIVRNPCTPSPLQDRLEAYYDRLCAFRRRLDPVPWDSKEPHHFTGGANLGFRIEAYDAVGGFQHVNSGEDARIVDDAARLGLRIRRDRTSIVHTSSRRDGRAQGGLAAHLRELDHAPHEAAPVAHPADVAWQYSMQARARFLFAERRFDRLADLLALPLDHIVGVARDCPNSEAFAMRIVPAPPSGMRQVTLEEAETLLAILETAATGDRA